ncbi:TPA_asm: N [Cynara alphacytorhabdovirus 1]|nr:TPA_asm: N [Cynara alphacytorhabdovirus 1]
MDLKLTEQEKNALKSALQRERAPSVPKPPVSRTIPVSSSTRDTPKTSSSTGATQQKISRFNDLESVTVSLSSKPKPWKDTELKNIKITHVTQLPATEAIAIGIEVVQSLRNQKVSSKVIDQLLSLATSLFSPSSISTTPSHLLKPIPDTVGNKIRNSECDPTNHNEQMAQQLAEKLKKVKGRIEKASEGEDTTKLRELEAKLNAQLNDLEGVDGSGKEINNMDDAYAYTYLAAYIMRLAGKTAAAWVDRLEMAKTRFNSWYDCDSTVLDSLDIEVDTAERIREGMARRPDCIATWVLWSAYNENENDRMDQNDTGMLRYLVTQMYSYTGMHSYASIMQLQIEHNVSFKFLLEELNCPVTRKAVYEVADIIRHHEVTEAHPERKTYFRYARVWDSGFFVNLQSKNCAVLGYTVAKARKMLSASTSVSDPTQAYAFKNMDDKIKSSLDVVADKLYEKIMAMATQDKESGSIWRT